jgi:peptidoglycan biosynthesis protein MviN/MurJ (putative lipid II flippase)
LVQGQLQKVLLENQDSWKLYQGLVDFQPLSDALTAWTADLDSGAAANIAALNAQVAQNVPAAVALSEVLLDVSRTLYGNYSGALNIYNLPTSLMAAITASVIPAVSAALTRRDRKGAARVAGSALRITALLAFPMGVGLFVLGTPIIQLIYPSLTPQIAGPLLSELGIATLFVCMMLVCNSILQAYGFINLPVVVMLLGGVLKIFNNYNLVARPSVGIFGAPFGNVLCFGLCMVLDLIIISRVIPGHPPLAPIFIKPAAAAGLMGLGCWAAYGLGSKALLATGKLCALDAATKQVVGLSRVGGAVVTIFAILVAVMIYGILVIALRALSRDDLMLMPKGEKIARILHLS